MSVETDGVAATKKWWAIDSLTIETFCPSSLSRVLKSRPASSLVPIVRKKFGDTSVLREHRPGMRG